MSQPVHSVAMRRFNFPAEHVFNACFDPVWLGSWMSHPGVRDERIVSLTLDARVGGKFSFVVNRQGVEVDHIGEYLEIDRPELLVFTWATRDSLPKTSRVIVEITPRGPGCEVKLTHVMGAGWSAQVDWAAGAWSRMLDALEKAIAQEGETRAVEIAR